MPKYTGQAEQVVLSLLAVQNILVKKSETLAGLEPVIRETKKAIAAFERMMGAMFEVTISSDDGKRRYTETIDPKAEEWGDFFNDKDSDFTRSLSRFSHKDIGPFNDNHFIFGWMESFIQSDNVPLWMHDSTGLFIEFRPI